MDSLEDIPSACGDSTGITNVFKKSPGETEKVDVTPENSEKADIVSATESIPALNTDPNLRLCMKKGAVDNNNVKHVDNKNMSKSCSLQEIAAMNCARDSTEQEAEDVKKTLAFTIDFGNGKDVNKQRHKSILERFEQKRHKRGQSLSKLEENEIQNRSSPSPMTPSKPPLSGKLPRRKLPQAPSESSVSSEQDDSRINVRLRDKSAQIRDSSKRHSWSPRSSLHENAIKSVPTSAGKTQFTPKSSVLSSALDAGSRNYPSLESSSNDPKSLESFMCQEPPLESFPQDEDAASDTGTYTLDGDNYTEEQKEKMNIDNLGPVFELTAASARPRRPNHFEEELEVIELDQPTPSPVQPRPTNMGKNILEVNYCHEAASSVKPKISYLEKLKSRVKNISEKTFQKSKSPEKILPSPDVGCFTSVTTSGILSYKPTLEDNVKFTRKNSLTKATIDSSEYVQGLTKVNVPVKSITDGEKPKGNQARPYQLNVFTQQNTIESSSTNPNTSSDSPKTSTDDESITEKTMQALKTASTKKDWIQEWARNAREYSSKQSTDKMSKSYDFERKQLQYDPASIMNKSDYYDSESDGQNPYSKAFHSFRNNNIGDYEYSSDPNLRYKEYQNIRKKQLEVDRGQFSDFGPVTSPTRARNAMLYGSDDEPSLPCGMSRKPPMSPCKIPSPIHTLSRPRSMSKSRGSDNGSITNLNDEAEIHLQNTAAAITALANLQRRNSMRGSLSNSLRNSPRSPMSPAHRISPKTTSPIHSLQSPLHLTDDELQQFSPQRHVQLRNYSIDSNTSGDRGLMNSSANSDSLLLQEYMRRQMRRPSTEIDQTFYHRGFEDDDDECTENIVIVEKGKIIQTKKQPVAASLPKQTLRTSIKNNLTKSNASIASPIKRSSSFSVKAQTEKLPGTPRLTNKLINTRTSNNPIQKSASSTSFKKMQMHYDEEHGEFYVNQGDDLDPDPDYSSISSDEEKEPITNTRYNKAFLMRVEQSKKAIAGGATTKQGLAACPNTPEMSRREANVRNSMRDRASMPRDSSLNRLKQDVISLSNAKKQLSCPSKDNSSLMTRSATSAVSGSNKVLPKYLDISKYKAPQGQGQSFLKKDESKSYLIKAEVKRSPSSAAVLGSRGDATRVSTRSVKSAGAKPSVKKVDPLAAAQEAKKQELEMWKRRAKYDPMKAAAEGKRKQEEAKKQQLHQERLSKNLESSVLRSQSCHFGGGSNIGTGCILLSNSPSNYNVVSLKNATGGVQMTGQNRWTLTSTDSSDIDDDFNTINS